MTSSIETAFGSKVMVDGFDERFYETMDQALVGFLNHSIGDPETLDDLKAKVMSIRALIAELKHDIISERGDIRSIKP